MISCSMASKIDWGNPFSFSPSFFFFWQIHLLCALNFSLSSYSKASCIRLQSYFPIFMLNWELYLNVSENQPPSSSQVAPTSYIAFLLWTTESLRGIKDLPGLPWPPCTNPFIQLSQEISSLLLYPKCLAGILLSEDHKSFQGFCQKFFSFLTLSCAPKPAQIHEWFKTVYEGHL